MRKGLPIRAKAYLCVLCEGEGEITLSEKPEKCLMCDGTGKVKLVWKDLKQQSN